MDIENLTRVHLIITGWVQGVGFRYYVREEAKKLYLTGWVRNLRSGEVEVVAEGEQTEIDKLVSNSRKGPRGAMVTSLKRTDQSVTGEFKNFKINFTV